MSARRIILTYDAADGRRVRREYINAPEDMVQRCLATLLAAGISVQVQHICDIADALQSLQLGDMVRVKDEAGHSRLAVRDGHEAYAEAHVVDIAYSSGDGAEYAEVKTDRELMGSHYWKVADLEKVVSTAQL